MVAYAVYKTSVAPEEGRDNSGRWIRLKTKEEINTQTSLL